MHGNALDEKAIFSIARTIAVPEARAAYLEQACGENAELRQRVQALLRGLEQQESFLESPAAAGLATDVPRVSEQTGRVIGPYKLLQQIGEGGMGVVYMAEQTEPVERRVALKIIKPGMDTRQVIARFEAERQALAVMDHPNIAKVLDAGATGEAGAVCRTGPGVPGVVADSGPARQAGPTGRPFFVMELVKGLPITQYCDEQHLTPRERLELFVPICQAVQHAHQKGIIHRDLKPSNILVARYDDKAVPKIIDFGVAKAVSQRLTERTMFTQYGQIVGTIEYMSPEQAQFNQLDVDTRSDIYSLGVLLYELLTGETPFDKQRLRTAAFDELLRIIREEEPPRPSTRLSSSETLPSIAANRKMEPKKLSTLVRGELDWIVMKALEKDRGRRYETASAFAADVQRYLHDEPVQACPPSAGYRLRKLVRRKHRGLMAAAAVFLGVITAAGSIGWTIRDRAVRAARAEEVRRDREASLSAHIGLILDEARRCALEQNWPEALAAARRAAAVAAGSQAGPQDHPQIGATLQELEFVQRLEQIRLERSMWRNGGFDNAAAAAACARSFRDFGVDLEQLPVDETVNRLKRHPQIVVPLASAIDDFAMDRLRLAGPSESGWRALVAVARRLDPDPLRDRLRATWGRPGTEGLLSELRTLAESSDVRTQPPATLTLLAESLRSIGLPDSERILLRRAQQAHPHDFWINFLLASNLARANLPSEAVRYYSVAVALRPSASAAHVNLGAMLEDVGRLEEAEACYRRAIELNPVDAVPYNNLGLMLANQKRLDEAETCYRQAIQLDPPYAAPHYNLGRLLRDQNDLPGAESSYRRAIELDPRDARSHNNLGEVLLQQQRIQEAEPILRRATELRPEYPEALNNLGSALQCLNLLEEAADAYRRAIGAGPEYHLAHYNLGLVLSIQKEWVEAAACFRRALELDPADADAQRALRLVLDKIKEPDGTAE